MQLFERDPSAYPFDYQTIETMVLRHETVCRVTCWKKKKMIGDLVLTRGRACHPEILHISDNLSCHLLEEIWAKTMTVRNPKRLHYTWLLLLLKAKSHVRAPKMCLFSFFSLWPHLMTLLFLPVTCLFNYLWRTVTEFSLFWMPGHRLWPYKFWLHFQSSVVPSSKH